MCLLIFFFFLAVNGVKAATGRDGYGEIRGQEMKDREQICPNDRGGAGRRAASLLEQ